MSWPTCTIQHSWHTFELHLPVHFWPTASTSLPLTLSGRLPGIPDRGRPLPSTSPARGRSRRTGKPAELAQTWLQGLAAAPGTRDNPVWLALHNTTILRHFVNSTAPPNRGKGGEGDVLVCNASAKALAHVLQAEGAPASTCPTAQKKPPRSKTQRDPPPHAGGPAGRSCRGRQPSQDPKPHSLAARHREAPTCAPCTAKTHERRTQGWAKAPQPTCLGGPRRPQSTAGWGAAAMGP